MSKISIGLCNPKSPTNVGAVMRAAGCFRADAILSTGERYDRAVKFHTDTQDAVDSIPLNWVDSLLEAVSEDATIVCVELVEGASSLPDYQHPENAFYVFGPEDGAIPQPLIDRADDVVFIPTRGCLNLAATVNVVLYDRTAKSSPVVDSNQLIRQSRDANNRLKIKGS